MSKKQRTKGLVEKLRNLALMMQDNDYPGRILRKEQLATKYRAREHEVHEALVQLNKEGLVSQARHTQCWDRGIKFNKCWHPDVYIVRPREETE